MLGGQEFEYPETTLHGMETGISSPALHGKMGGETGESLEHCGPTSPACAPEIKMLCLKQAERHSPKPKVVL